MQTPRITQDIQFEAQLMSVTMQFHSTWGLFSPKAIDEGTGLLLAHIEVPAGASVLDLGCGYGPIGLAIAKHDPTSQVHLVDKDFVAIDYTQKNAAANGLSNATAFLSNGFSHVPAGQKYDVVVSNVPAKIGSELLETFLHDAYEHLNPGGQIYVVVISGLKDYMKRHLSAVFGNYDKLKQSKTYTASRAVKVH